MEQTRVGILGYLARLWQRLGRGGRRVLGERSREALTARSLLVRTQVPPAVYAQRERLYASALQLLDDPQAARQVVAEALRAAALALAQQGARTGAAGRAPALIGEPLAEAELAGWLDRSVLRLSLLRLRVTPKSMHSSEPLEPPPEDEASGRSGPLDAIAGEGRGHSISDTVGQLERIGDALATLPAEIRAAVVLVIMQGRSLTEAADLLGIREEACAFFLSHGRKLLRRTLQRDLIAAEDVLGAGSILLQPRELHDLHGSKKATARA